MCHLLRLVYVAEVQESVAEHALPQGGHVDGIHSPQEVHACALIP